MAEISEKLRYIMEAYEIDCISIVGTNTTSLRVWFVKKLAVIMLIHLRVLLFYI